MAIRYVSEIAEAEYAAWRGVLFGLPDTYSAWRWFFKHDIAEASSGGNEVAVVKIRPDEFLTYCNVSRITPDMQSFRNFAHLKSNNQ